MSHRLAKSLKEIDIRNLSLNPQGEEREIYKHSGDSSERSEQRADLGIAALGATLPHPPVEDAKRRPDPLPATPSPLRHADFNRFLAYLNASHPIVVGYLRNHCDLDNTRYERGHVEIPLLTIVENEQDEILIKAVKAQRLRERAAGTLESCAQKVRDVLREDGTRWVVTFVNQEAANV